MITVRNKWGFRVNANRDSSGRFVQTPPVRMTCRSDDGRWSPEPERRERAELDPDIAWIALAAIWLTITLILILP